MPTDTLTGRQLDRALAVALGWRAEVISFPWQSPRWAIVDSNHSPIDNDAKSVALTAEAAWEHCPPFSADTPEGWGAMRIVVERMRELGWYWTLRGGPERDVYVEFWHRESNDRVGTGLGTTLPEAVARASLAALSAKEATDGN